MVLLPFLVYYLNDVCVYTAGVGGFAADGMAAKMWTCTL